MGAVASRPLPRRLTLVCHRPLSFLLLFFCSISSPSLPFEWYNPCASYFLQSALLGRDVPAVPPSGVVLPFAIVNDCYYSSSPSAACCPPGMWRLLAPLRPHFV